jgi:hypothetical protein
MNGISDPENASPAARPTVARFVVLGWLCAAAALA